MAGKKDMTIEAATMDQSSAVICKAASADLMGALGVRFWPLQPSDCGALRHGRRQGIFHVVANAPECVCLLLMRWLCYFWCFRGAPSRWSIRSYRRRQSSRFHDRSRALAVILRYLRS